MDRVTTIIPCFNASAYIEQAITSALNQSYKNHELIVVDDGSTDESLEIIKKYSKNVRWISGPNRGGSSARNRGLELASGKYIQFLDADDFISSDKIERQIKLLKNNDDYAVATSMHCYCSTAGVPEPIHDSFTWHDYPEALNLLVDIWKTNDSFPVHAWLTPKALIEKTGRWNEQLTGDDDGEYFGRVLLNANSVVFADNAIAYYRRPAAGNVSCARKPENIRSYFETWNLLQAEILNRRQDPEARLAVLRRLRILAYFYANRDPEWIDWAARREACNWFYDFNIPIPLFSKLMIGLLGIRRGLHVRSVASIVKSIIQDNKND